jgi:hypothetical protein
MRCCHRCMVVPITVCSWQTSVLTKTPHLESVINSTGEKKQGHRSWTAVQAFLCINWLVVKEAHVLSPDVGLLLTLCKESVHPLRCPCFTLCGQEATPALDLSGHGVETRGSP